MEKSVAFVVLGSRAVWLQNRVGIRLDVSCIEEFIKFISRLSTIHHIWTDVVKVTETTGELYMPCIVKTSLAKDDHSILRTY